MPSTRAAPLPLTFLLAGCGVLHGGGAPEPPADSLSTALVAMEGTRFDRAQAALEPIVARCMGGRGEVEALLVMSVLHLDPRNDARNPAAAAHYAARVIRHPDVTAVDLEVARALYLAARDIGAPPLEGSPGAGEPTLAMVGLADRRPPPCPGETAEARRGLPRHPGPVLAATVAQARAALDSATATPQETVRTVEVPVESSSAETERLRARVKQLEAELARIRKLLGGGG